MHVNNSRNFLLCNYVSLLNASGSDHKSHHLLLGHVFLSWCTGFFCPLLDNMWETTKRTSSIICCEELPDNFTLQSLTSVHLLLHLSLDFTLIYPPVLTTGNTRGSSEELSGSCCRPDWWKVVWDTAGTGWCVETGWITLAGEQRINKTGLEKCKWSVRALETDSEAQFDVTHTSVQERIHADQFQNKTTLQLNASLITRVQIFDNRRGELSLLNPVCYHDLYPEELH